MLSGVDWGQYGLAALHAVQLFFLNPIVYIATGLLIWDSFRRSRAQKRFFGYHIRNVWRPLFLLALQAILTGAVLSILFLAAGVVLTPGDLWVIGGLTIVAGLIRLRFAASFYGIAVFVLLSLIVKWVHISVAVTGVKWVVATMQQASVLNIILLGVGLGLAEWLFFFLRRSTTTGPALIASGRGRAIGAMFIQSSAVFPVLIFQPGSNVHYASTWWPLGDHGVSGLSLMALPLLIGLNGVFASLSAERVSLLSRRYSLVLTLLLALDGFLVYEFSSDFALIGVACILLVKEVLGWHLRHGENEQDALYPASPDGVRILAVLPESTAASMELLPGEIITKVNQLGVHSHYDLHFALDQNPAYAKLEVLDNRGELRIVGKPVYTGETSKIGLVLLPEDGDREVYGKSSCGWLHSLYLKKLVLRADYGTIWNDLGPPPVTD